MIHSYHSPVCICIIMSDTVLIHEMTMRHFSLVLFFSFICSVHHKFRATETPRNILCGFSSAFAVHILCMIFCLCCIVCVKEKEFKETALKNKIKKG